MPKLLTATETGHPTWEAFKNQRVSSIAYSETIRFQTAQLVLNASSSLNEAMVDDSDITVRALETYVAGSRDRTQKSH
jgi:hypothetical protein